MAIDKPVILASKTEEDEIARKLMVFINKCPNIPPDIDRGSIQYEQLPDGVPAMAISTIQGTAITRRYVTGGHEAEYQFKIIYRIQPGNSSSDRLDADETLDKISSWAMEQRPNLGGGINVRRIEPTTRSAVFAAYENGDEDHQILMKLTYEVF